MSLWITESPGSLPLHSDGEWAGSIYGNDAFIVATELRARGLSVTCHLLDPTGTDYEVATRLLGSDSIVTVGGKPGSGTRALCIEDLTGMRRWIFSRTPCPSTSIGSLTADMLDIDCYQEFVSYFNSQFANSGAKSARVVANFSVVNDASAVPPLAFTPFAIQVSATHALTLDQAHVLAFQMLRKTSAHLAFVTLGGRGTVLASGSSTWHAASSAIPGSVLGAGAVFSSAVILGLSRGLDQEPLLRWCVRGSHGTVGIQLTVQEDGLAGA